jgi:hypothetical protein
LKNVNYRSHKPGNSQKTDRRIAAAALKENVECENALRSK